MDAMMNAYIVVGHHKQRDHLGDHSIGGMIVIILILKEYVARL
jgi:hypothetical protein